MKLLMIIALRAYEDQLSQILSDANVGIYSELDLRGYNTLKKTVDPLNWFSANREPESSLLLMVVADETQTREVMNQLESKNKQEWEDRPSHAFQLKIENLI